MAKNRAENEQFFALISHEGHGFKRAYSGKAVRETIILIGMILGQELYCHHRPRPWGIRSIARADIGSRNDSFQGPAGGGGAF
jgi:hypothetical protein